MQTIALCEVYGLELYRNAKQEVGLFVAVSKKAKQFEHLLCPTTPLTLKWTGKEFFPYTNVTVDGISEFHYFATKCCNLLVGRHTNVEVSYAVELFLRNFYLPTARQHSFFLHNNGDNQRNTATVTTSFRLRMHLMKNDHDDQRLLTN